MKATRHIDVAAAVRTTDVNVLTQGLCGGSSVVRKMYVPLTSSRPNGAGEIYTYFPLTEGNEAAILRVPGSRKNPDYGFSVGRGAFTWPVGRWVDVALRVKLNEMNKQDGQFSAVFWV